MKWTLTKTTQDGAFNKAKNENEIRYHYRSDEGDTVEFYSHPTKAWTHLGKESKKGTLTKVINAQIEQGLKQHDYKGGFDEAIKELNV